MTANLPPTFPPPPGGEEFFPLFPSPCGRGKGRGWLAGLALRALGALAGLFRRRHRPEPVYSGRQQLRQAARGLVARQLGRAPVARAVRREAAREVARLIGRGR